MFLVDPVWAGVTILLALLLYAYISYNSQRNEWGSGLDGLKFNLALQSLLSLQSGQKHRVNWRPHLLVLYRVNAYDISNPTGENKSKHHEILQLYSQLRKGRGMCVVAAVLKGERTDDKMLRKAR